ncbi:MAG: RNA-binding protein [Ruminococcus sp.]|nr:RNA-binding protein [Ruminococcus sp.]
MSPDSHAPDRLFSAKLADLAKRCERECCGVFSRFLDERQCAEAELWCRQSPELAGGGLRYGFFGGFPDARRKLLGIYPDYFADCIGESIPIKCLTFTFRREDKLSHRDFLGSFMALQLKRETVGDVAVAEGMAQAAVTDIAAKDIMSSITKIGRVGVKVTDSRPFELTLEGTAKFKETGGTVASMRLDCVAALAANISREKAALLIRSEKINVNHFTVTSVSHELKEGDVLSVRGCGRFLISGINGVTKKNRIHIILKKYI